MLAIQAFLGCFPFATLAVLFPTAFAQEGESDGHAHGDGPEWVFAGKLNTAREYHTATLLPDGRVLVIGGRARESGFNADWDAGPYKSAEIYDPQSQTWHSTGNLDMARFSPTATLLPNGQVLVTGGGSDSRKAELYDPATGTWRSTGSLIVARNGHTATLLPNGRVLIVGGADGGDSRTGIASAVRSAELYDPATETWSNVEGPGTAPLFHTSVPLPGGRVLIVSLRSHAAYVVNRDCTKLAQVYDVVSARWSPGTSSAAFTCSLGQGDKTRAALLGNGLVLVTGFGTAELYDPTTGEWKVTAAPSRVGSGHTLTLLANGQVLATGGHSGDFSVADAEVYDPDTQTWRATTPLTRNRAAHSASLLANGKVLVAGGFDGSCCDSRYTLDTSELFDVVLPDVRTLTSVSAANYSAVALARDSIVAAFGTGLATTSMQAGDALTTQLGGTTVAVKDSRGIERLAPISFVSPEQVSYQVPPGTAEGLATMTITNGDGAASTGVSLIRDTAPSLFTANGSGRGVAAAIVRRITAGGSSQKEPVAAFDRQQNQFVAIPIDMGPLTDRVTLVLSGTGIRFRTSLSSAIVTVGGVYAQLIYAGPQPNALGMDQVEVVLPRSAAGSGEVDILLTVDGQIANPVRINFK